MCCTTNFSYNVVKYHTTSNTEQQWQKHNKLYSELKHYCDVIMGAMAYQITSLRLFTQPFMHAQIKENIKAPRHWPLCGEFTGDRWIPRTNGQLRGNVYIWWRHHGRTPCVPAMEWPMSAVGISENMIISSCECTTSSMWFLSYGLKSAERELTDIMNYMYISS